MKLREDVVSSFNSYCDCVFTNGKAAVWGIADLCSRAFNVIYDSSLTYITIISLTAYNQVKSLECKVKRPYGYSSFYVVIGLLLSSSCLTLKVVWVCVVHGIAVIATNTKSKSRNGVIVKPCCKSVFVRHFKFKS